MLALALKARIPIIRASTGDLLSLEDVLQSIAPAGMKVRPFSVSSTVGDILYTTSDFVPTADTYEDMRKAGRVLLLINHEPSPFAFDAGEIPVPRDLMLDVIKTASAKNALALLPLFNGLTLKQAAEVCRLTQTRDKMLTRKGIVQTRALLIGKIAGLASVDVMLPLYLCPEPLKNWLEMNKPYFLEGKDERLMPRGILFHGIPGVGKSAAAKYIANELDVPLYRLALGAALTKWQGESEENLGRILTTLDQEEPAVLLIDETEKLFADNEDQGTTARLLSQLLWWMAEHRSRVLTVMTTNNLKALPAELYRAGRIDSVMEISQCGVHQARALGEAWLRQFITPTPSQLKKIRAALSGGSPHAEVIKVVSDIIKNERWI